MTSKAEDYRRRARACLLMAGTIASDERRAALVEMAQVWTELCLAEYKVASGADPTKTMVSAGETIQKAIASGS